MFSLQKHLTQDIHAFKPLFLIIKSPSPNKTMVNKYLKIKWAVIIFRRFFNILKKKYLLKRKKILVDKLGWVNQSHIASQSDVFFARCICTTIQEKNIFFS